MTTENLPESEVLKECLGILKANGIFCWRQNTGAAKVGKRFVRFGYPGISDILGILPDGRFLAVEVKRSRGGVVSDDQRKFLAQVRLSGGVSVVANSGSSLRQGLLEMGYKIN